MADTNSTFEADFAIRSYEVGKNQRTKIPTIANLFQESAGLHAKKLKFDITDLHKLELTWVLYKLHIKVYEFPSRWEQVRIKTWPSTGSDIRAFRTYEMRNKEGNLCAKALGQWMTLDLKSRRPVQIPKKLSKYPHLEQIGDTLNADKKPFKPVENTAAVFITKVGEHDLDMNNHVNSVKYIEWSTGYQRNKEKEYCYEVLIQHQAEAHFGDSIYQSVDQLENSQKVTLYNQNGKALSTAHVYFG